MASNKEDTMTQVKLAELERKPRNELTEYEREILEEHEFRMGPMSLLMAAVKDELQVLISCRQDTKILARVKAFDRHFNLLLVNAKLMWMKQKLGGRRGDLVPAERFISKMLLRGDGVIMVVLVGK